ncbi:hypothetical protein [Mycolicibacterium tokaiense]|uniref:hypothetical protein n=1 Tax=Mycolicibacterium tokaiense TaxID=39695 RepID=UPI0011C07C8B|nr:hypothetical protein [Mycolicibacterium tokaiense]BBY87826.1 hypothetical protein MTOK_36080 [Mycolicibacterium tokaiense]
MSEIQPQQLNPIPLVLLSVELDVQIDRIVDLLGVQTVFRGATGLRCCSPAAALELVQRRDAEVAERARQRRRVPARADSAVSQLRPELETRPVVRPPAGDA